MTLPPVTISSRPPILAKELSATPEAQVASAAPAAPVSQPCDAVVLCTGYCGEELLPEDDGPGAGGGYLHEQDPVEGPGAGGGYDPDEILPGDDVPGGDDGVDQDPAEADGPGAGGGYLTGSAAFPASSSPWSQPLAVLSDPAGQGSTSYVLPWLQLPAPAESAGAKGQEK